MIQLYSGLVRNGKWYNYTEVSPLPGGALALMEGGDRTGAARILNLVKGSITSLFTEAGEEYILTPKDYKDLMAVDSWKIGYEQIKLKFGGEYPIFPEYFFCPVCSRPGMEKYTEVNESWQELVEKGLIDETFQETEEINFEIILPEPFTVEGAKTIVGGTYDKLIVRPLTINDMLSIQHDSESMSSDANQIYATWDASIVEVCGMSERDFNILKRTSQSYFTKKYINTEANIDAMMDAYDGIKLGFNGSDRKVSCNYCGTEIGGSLDFTNFFSLLLKKKSFQNSNK